MGAPTRFPYCFGSETRVLHISNLAGLKNWVCLLLMKTIMRHYLSIVSAQMISTESKKTIFFSDTIISWRDPEYSTELALSFQKSTGCSYIWDNICSVQRNLHFNSLNNETFHNANRRELPVVELSTLPLILKTVAESGIADQMRLTELILSDQDFFRKLMGLFRICEDLENVDGLHMLYKIVRGIILLDSPQILEKIVGDDLIMDIIGSLEYGREAGNVKPDGQCPVQNHTVIVMIHEAANG